MSDKNKQKEDILKKGDKEELKSSDNSQKQENKEITLQPHNIQQISNRKFY